MPKIEVEAKQFFKYAGEQYTSESLEAILPVAKAELDGFDGDGIIKIELNDTNRPDLWSSAGVGRQLKVYKDGQIPQYSFFSTKEKTQESGDYTIKVDPSVQPIRPFIAGFVISGKTIDDTALKDIIQTQEKLCWNFGQKRKSIAMGVYRSDLISFPVDYKAVDPDTTLFTPLGMNDEISMRQMLKDHPKGQEFGHIVADKPAFPLLTSSNGEVLSFPPVINSANLGAVKIGDEKLFIELTGTDLYSLVLACSIVACDLSDAGHTIHPVKVVYPYDTLLGREIVTPFYFQEKVSVHLPEAEKVLGVSLTVEEAAACLKKMGCLSEIDGDKITVTVPEYRNDFLHSVDITEDIMMGRGLNSFEPLLPADYTVGRLSSEELFARQIRDILVGLGFQEMMYNYLGSGKDFIEKMNISGENLVQILNPMSENYEYIRNSIIPHLLQSESISGNAVYPHNIFEVGKIAFVDEKANYGSETRNYLGLMSSDREAGFNLVNSQVSALLFYMGKDYTLKELHDPRFIEGRSAEIYCKDVLVGMFGEIHPSVLENWGIGVPCTICEIDLDLLIK